jgi:hypothetical protein
MAQGRIVESTIGYLGECVGKPVFGMRHDLNNLPLVTAPVTVEDVRPIRDQLSLDVEGFVLADHETAVTDFTDRAEVARVYMRELEELLMELTGASKVAASAGGVLRRGERSPDFMKGGFTTPARFAHCDYSQNPAGSTYWTEPLLNDEERERYRGGRLAIYNLWRALTPPPQDAPLACADARTVAAEDRVWSDCIIAPPPPEIRFENSVFRPNPAHRWCYFKDMTPAEVLVFKGYDSDPARAAGVPHCAFDDPSCPPDAPARESIDVRAFAFFDN